MKRLQDWPRRLNDFLDARRTLPFAWGSNDCGTFAIDCIEAITATRVLAVDWTSEEEAMAVIARHGGMLGLVSYALGAPHGDWKRLRRGDVALVPQNDEGWLGTMVSIGTEMVGPSLDGLKSKPITSAVHCWRIG